VATAADSAVPRPEFVTPTARILEPALVRQLIAQRQQLGIDKYDEVWDGVYVVTPLPTNPHQALVTDLTTILNGLVKEERRGTVLAGANVSDRREGWEHNFRGPDVVVVLRGGTAVDCGTHWMGGPDFLVEIQSPGDDTDEKIPFYEQLRVRELLVIHRDRRTLRLYRHNGEQFSAVPLVAFQRGRWLRSEVLPLAFRRRVRRGVALTELRRTDGKAGGWLV
jgi:Uma2 family endonuclease